MRIGLRSRKPFILLARDMGALADLRGRKEKGPEPPGTWGPSGDLFRGLSGGPGSFSFTHPPRDLWGPPELLGTSRPADPRASGGPTGTPGSGPEGPGAQGAPGALRSRRDRRWTGGPGPEAYVRGPLGLSRPGK